MDVNINDARIWCQDDAAKEEFEGDHVGGKFDRSMRVCAHFGPLLKVWKIKKTWSTYHSF